MRSKYNIVEFISYLSKNNSLDNCYQVVWGGGEPTLDKSFEQILEAIEKHANPNIYHRVFTNSSRFSPAIKKYLENLSNHSAEIYVVLLEDLYESLHGDGKFHYMDSVFIQKVDALRYCDEKKLNLIFITYEAAN